jgi:hypothetical protein
MSACVVCGLSDRRGLVQVRLHAGGMVTLCGTHALVMRRSRSRSRTLEELKATTCDRRARERRGESVDELAAALTAAFAGDRRAADRRR